QQSPSPDVAGCQMHHRQRKSGGYRCIHGVAAFAHYGNAGLGGFAMHADHQGVLGMDRPQAVSMAPWAECQADGNQMKNQRLAQSFHWILISIVLGSDQVTAANEASLPAQGQSNGRRSTQYLVLS